MNVFINDKKVETFSKTLFDLASELSLPEKGVAVAVNNSMKQRNEWQKTYLAEGDNIVIIKAACGG